MHSENPNENELCDFGVYTLAELGVIGSASAPDEANLKEEVHALRCTAAGPYNTIAADFLRVGSMCGLGLDIFGIHTLSLAARYRIAANSGTLAKGFARIQAVRRYDRLPICATTSEWKDFFLKNPSMAHSTMETYELACRLDHTGRIADCPNDKKQKAATTFLRDEIPKQDFAKPVAARLSRILGRVSRFRIAQILPQMKFASRASRPGLTVGLLRILCNGLCTAKRCHVEGEEQRCRVGCSDEPDSLSHHHECPLLYNFFASVWRQAIVLPRRGHLFQVLITEIFLRSLQYGIVVMGVIDAVVYAHNHSRNIDNPGNFGDCMKGRIRFMTATTPAYAHACQLICLTGHIPLAPHSKFRLQAATARCPHLPHVRTTARERGNDFQEWAVYTDGSSRRAAGETFAGWGVVARSLHGRIDVMFGPLITTEAPLAFAGPRIHPNDTAEMSAIAWALGPVAL